MNVDIYSYYQDMDFNGDIYSEEPKEWILKTEPEKLTDGRYILIDYIQIK